MTITSLINVKGLDRSSINPRTGSGNLQRDPFAPNFELILYSGRGAQPVKINDESNSNIIQFIDEITYEDSVDQFPQMTIVLKGQIDKQGSGEVNSLIDSKLFSEGQTVQMRFGYGKALFTIGACEIVKIEPVFPESDLPSLTITGFDLLHRAARSKPRKGVSYKGFRDSQIASIIGARNGFDIKSNDPSTFQSIRKVSGVKDRVQNKGVSDYEFIKKVAAINNFDVFSRFDPKRKKFALFFQPPKTQNFKDIHKFVYNEGDLSYHNTLLSFTPKLDASDQATDFEIFVIKDKKVGGSKFEPVLRLTLDEQKKIKDLQDRRFQAGKVGPEGGKKPQNSDGIEIGFKAFGRAFRFPKHKRFTSEEDAKKSIQEFIKRQKENFITGDGTLIGLESLQSRQIVELLGISEQFSGKYYLTKVVHRMSRSDGYKCDFSCRKAIKDIVVQPTPQLSFTNLQQTFDKFKGVE